MIMVSITAIVSDNFAAAAGTSLALIATMVLAVLLMQKEAVSGLSGPRAIRWSQALDIALPPLALIFILTMILKFIDMWS